MSAIAPNAVAPVSDPNTVPVAPFFAIPVTNFVNWAKVDTRRIVSREVSADRTVIDKLGKVITYSTIMLGYNYGTAEAPVVKQFLMELPERTTGAGLILEVSKDGKERNYSLFTSFPKDDPITAPFLESWRKIITRLTHIVVENNNKLGTQMISFDEHDLLNPERTIKKTNKSFDPMIPEIKPDRSKDKKFHPDRMYLKLVDRVTSNGKTFKTQIRGLNNKPMDWDFLVGKKLTHLSVMNFEKIYFGPKISTVTNLTSSIIIDFSSEKNDYFRQADSLSKYATDERLKEFLRKLELEDKDKESSSSSSSSSSSEKIDDRYEQEFDPQESEQESQSSPSEERPIKAQMKAPPASIKSILGELKKAPKASPELN